MSVLQFHAAECLSLQHAKLAPSLECAVDAIPEEVSDVCESQQQFAKSEKCTTTCRDRPIRP